MFRTLLIGFVSLLLLGARPVSEGDSRSREAPGPAVVTVTIRDRQFSPSTLTVKKGQTVVWVNNDELDHTVQASDGSFASGTLKKKGAFRYTFQTVGKFSYFCKFHPREKGTILVAK